MENLKPNFEERNRLREERVIALIAEYAIQNSLPHQVQEQLEYDFRLRGRVPDFIEAW